MIDAKQNQLVTIYRVTPPGGLTYTTNRLREVLDEVNLVRYDAPITIIKVRMTRAEAEADAYFMGSFQEA